MTKETCICCHENEVTWPKVCPECRDDEAQEELENWLIQEGVRDLVEAPMGDGMHWSGGECRTCGMLYDGGSRCTYCSDPDPWDTGDF